MAWHEYPTNWTDTVNNISNNNVTSLGGFLQYSNSVVNGFLGFFILIMTFAISFMSLKGSSGDKAFAAASFFSLIVAILLFRIALISFEILMIPVIMTIVGVLLVRSEREKLGL